MYPTSPLRSPPCLATSGRVPGRGRIRRAAAAGLVLGVAFGCRVGEERSELRPADRRYRVLLQPAADARPGGMALRFEPREGWHIEPEAAALLELAAPDGYALDAPMQRGEDALEHSERALAFAWSMEPVATAPDPDPRLRARVKFGICHDDASVCEIVRRELDLPAAPPPG